MAETETKDDTPLRPSSTENSVPDYDAIFAKGGGKSQHTQFAQKTAIGEFRNPKRFSYIEWIFLIVATLSLLAVLGLNIERFHSFHKNFYNLTALNNYPFRCLGWYCTADFLFSVVLLVNLVFCFFYCYDGLFRERKFELLAFVVAIAVITVYVIGNYIFVVIKHENSATGTERDLRIARLVLICILAPVNIVLAILSWWKMGYLAFNVIGSNEQLTSAYHLRSFFTTVQYFHVEIMANVVVLSFALHGQLLSTAEEVILIFLAVYLLAVVFFGSMAVQWESKVGVVVWYVLMVPVGAYYIYKLVEVSIHWSYYSKVGTEYHEDGTSVTVSLKFVGVALLFTVLLGMVAVILLFTCMILVLRNFKLALREKVDPPFKNCFETLSTNRR